MSVVAIHILLSAMCASFEHMPQVRGLLEAVGAGLWLLGSPLVLIYGLEYVWLHALETTIVLAPKPSA